MCTIIATSIIRDVGIAQALDIQRAAVATQLKFYRDMACYSVTLGRVFLRIIEIMKKYFYNAVILRATQSLYK